MTRRGKKRAKYRPKALVMPPSPPPPARALHADFGTPQRQFHDWVVVREVWDQRQAAIRDQAQIIYSRDPLATYHRRGIITARQLAAGRRVEELWRDASKGNPGVASYNPAHVDGRRGVNSEQITEARIRFERLMNTVSRVAAGEILAVCCFGETLKGSAQGEILRRGLALAAEFFRI